MLVINLMMEAGNSLCLLFKIALMTPILSFSDKSKIEELFQCAQKGTGGSLITSPHSIDI